MNSIIQFDHDGLLYVVVYRPFEDIFFNSEATPASGFP